MHRLALALLVLAACHSDPTPATTAGPPATTDEHQDTNAHAAIALAVVYEAHNLWMGNDSYVKPEDGASTHGYNEAIWPALGKFASAGGAGSTAVFIAYGNNVSVVGHADDLRAFKPDAFVAPQQAFEKVFTRDLRAGLALAQAELAKQAAPRKVLVVIGDGADTVVDVSVSDVAPKLHDAGIEAYTVFAPIEMLDGDPEAMTALGDAGHFAVEQASGLGPVVDQVVAQINAK